MSQLEWILAVAGGITVLGSAGAVLAKLISPARRLTRRVIELEKSGEKSLETIADIQEMNRLLCEGLLSMLENTITGNSVDKIKDMRTKIQNYLIRK